ncbi:MAG: translation initiation factor IF-2 N-terminal domain-containing protein [Acidimicrobiia bacterium]|nr:translation initiation factor IF-2 N-terminal domain-containing protein [Acidimicrobiia bacterium]
MRIYELARDLGRESRDVLTRAQEMGLDVKTASSGLDDESAELLRLSFAPGDTTSGEAETIETPTEPDVAAVDVAAADGDQTAASPTEPEPEAEPERDIDITSVKQGASVAEFAEAVSQPVGEVVKGLLGKGIAAGANQTMPAELIDELGESFGFIVEIEEP